MELSPTAAAAQEQEQELAFPDASQQTHRIDLTQDTASLQGTQEEQREEEVEEEEAHAEEPHERREQEPTRKRRRQEGHTDAHLDLITEDDRIRRGARVASHLTGGMVAPAVALTSARAAAASSPVPGTAAQPRQPWDGSTGAAAARDHVAAARGASDAVSLAVARSSAESAAAIQVGAALAAAARAQQAAAEAEAEADAAASSNDSPPLRPQSAFLFYLAAHRAKIQAAFPELDLNATAEELRHTHDGRSAPLAEAQDTLPTDHTIEPAASRPIMPAASAPHSSPLARLAVANLLGVNVTASTSRVLGFEWRRMDASARAVYEEQASRDRRRFREEKERYEQRRAEEMQRSQAAGHSASAAAAPP